MYAQIIFNERFQLSLGRFSITGILITGFFIESLYDVIHPLEFF
jgi:hypothetical protein